MYMYIFIYCLVLSLDCLHNVTIYMYIYIYKIHIYYIQYIYIYLYIYITKGKKGYRYFHGTHATIFNLQFLLSQSLSQMILLENIFFSSLIAITHTGK